MESLIESLMESSSIIYIVIIYIKEMRVIKTNINTFTLIFCYRFKDSIRIAGQKSGWTCDRQRITVYVKKFRNTCA